MRKRRVLGLVALIMTLVFTGAHAFVTDRFGLDPEPQRSARLIDKIPNRSGDWVAEINQNAISNEEKAIGSIVGYVSKTYTNLKLNQQIQVMVL